LKAGGLGSLIAYSINSLTFPKGTLLRVNTFLAFEENLLLIQTISTITARATLPIEAFRPKHLIAAAWANHGTGCGRLGKLSEF